MATTTQVQTERTIDPSFVRRRAVIDDYNEGVPGDSYFRLVSARWLSEAESRGLHHIFVDVLDEQGNRIVGETVWLINGGVTYHKTEEKRGEPFAAAIPMFAEGFAYGVSVGGHSDFVRRMGLGSIEHPDAKTHACYELVFQRAVFGVVEPPAPTPPTADWSRVLRMARELQAELSAILERQ